MYSDTHMAIDFKTTAKMELNQLAHVSFMMTHWSADPGVHWKILIIYRQQQHFLRHWIQIHPRVVDKVRYDVQHHMGQRAKEGNRQLKPESFIICQDENDQKSATPPFNKCTKHHKDAGKRDKESLRGFMSWRFIGWIPLIAATLSTDLLFHLTNLLNFYL